MPTLKITESRLALVVSAAALLATFWQGYEARKANAFNQEALIVEVQPSDIPSKRIEKVVCIDKGPTTVYMFWRVDVFNSSSQAVTVKDIFSMSSSPAGSASGIAPISKDGPIDPKFPIVIEPKNFKRFLLSVPALTSPSFGEWLRASGGCNDKFDWGSAANRGGYSETGWPTARAVNANFIVTTGNGNEFNAISNWP